MSSGNNQSPEIATKTLDEVRTEELIDILKRRRAAFLAREGDDSSAAERASLMETADGLVGLALSGGGMRSASFNLGLLQAFYSRGLLRFVDYLSTVSGGGYVGSLITSTLCRPDASLSGDNCPLSCGKQGQPQRIRDFIGSGTYLLRFVQFANRYLIGTLLNNVAIFSALLFLAALTAWLWRSLDCNWFRDRLSALGLDSDVWPALFPGLVLSLAWLMAWSISYWRSGARADGRTARILLVLTTLAFVTGLAILIGNGDVTIAGVDSTLLQSLRWPIALATALGLVPFMLPKLVMRSGLQPKNLVESWIFYYASTALLLGVPLLLIGLLGRENISGFATQRGPQLCAGDIKDPERFAYWVLHGNSRTEETGGPDMTELWRPLKSGASSSSLAGAKPKSRIEIATAANDLLSACLAERTIQDKVLGTETWNGDSPTWIWWKYGAVFRPVGLLFGHLFSWAGDSDEFAEFIEKQEVLRKRTESLLDTLNKYVLGERNFAKYRTFTQLKDGGLGGGGAAAQGSPLREDVDKGDSPLPSLATAATSAAAADDVLEHYIRLRDLLGMQAFTLSDIADFNRRLLERYYPDFFRRRSEIRRVTVIQHDQRARLIWCGGALLLFMLCSSLIRPNDTSLQGYYRNRLARTFLEYAPGRSELLLHEVDSHTRGAPYHLFGATANALDWRSPSLPMESFLFSPRFCGSLSLGFRRSTDYARGGMDVATAMAVSGAAVSPSYFRNWLIRSMFLVLNLRLGQWLPNPATGSSLMQPSILQLLSGLRKPAAARPYLFVTDGGHIENLGLGQLLDRRCALIIVSDAGHDPHFDFADFARLIQTRRICNGIEFTELDGLTPLSIADRLPMFHRDQNPPVEPRGDTEAPAAPRRHFFCARIRYPDDQASSTRGILPVVKEGILIYTKPSLSGDEDIDVLHYQTRSPDFPHEATADQAFEPDQIEAYRQLGFHIGNDLCRGMTDALRATTTMDIDALAQIFAAELTEPASGEAELDESDLLAVAATVKPTSDAGAISDTPPPSDGSGPAFHKGKKPK